MKMKRFKIKKKYQNITIPYFYANYDKDIVGYIYKNEFYSEDNLNNLFNEFIGFYLNYHIEINGKLQIVHSLEDVAKLLLDNYDNFVIPLKYKDDFSENEYKEFIKVQKFLKEKKHPKFNEPTIVKEYEHNIFRKLKNFFHNYHWNKFLEEMKKYNYDIPTKVYSKQYKRYFYIANGQPYWSVLNAFEEIYFISFYYQYNGDGINEYSNHFHSHDFEYIIRDVIDFTNEFQIYEFQKKFFSKQEINFLNALKEKLINMNYKPSNNNKFLYNGPLAKKYYEYYDKNKYFKAFLYDKKLQRIVKNNKKQDLINHKI